MSEYGLCESCSGDEATHEVIFVTTPDQRESIPFKACKLCAEYAERKSGARIRPFDQEAHHGENDTPVPEVPEGEPGPLP